MIFIDNKYTRWYYSIINAAKARSLTNYVERHHIIPRSLGGDDNESNLVDLTAREHFVCHLLLTKMTDGLARRKMLYARNFMLSHSSTHNRYKVTSSVYNKLKEEFSKVNPFNDPVVQEHIRNKNTGSKRSIETRARMVVGWTDERRAHISKINTGRKNGDSPFRGKKRPELSGSNNGFFGKTHSDEFIEQERLKRIGKPAPWSDKKKACEYCSKIFDLGNYSKSHGDKCKLKSK